MEFQLKLSVSEAVELIKEIKELPAKIFEGTKEVEKLIIGRRLLGR